ncbi:hypothetical protein E2K93_05130 [Thalassotalea sp. HSM 43]|nr:hypothetical protein E2K93_05130 [Thalassotalea sp. HSM 43]
MINSLLLDYARPWKLVSLLIGVILLIVGSYYYEAPDWDIPISLIMAFVAYLTAPWSMRVLIKRQWSKFPLMLFFMWFGVDGCYSIYWYFVDPIALEIMRDVNFLASLVLYCTCGLIWFYDGNLTDIYKAYRNAKSST